MSDTDSTYIFYLSASGTQPFNLKVLNPVQVFEKFQLMVKIRVIVNSDVLNRRY